MDLDRLLPFENIFLCRVSVYSFCVRDEVEYRQQWDWEITIEGKYLPKSLKSFLYVGFPAEKKISKGVA
ncbi:hypothetical protein OROMI_030317 [Orobanche minor]